MRACAQHTPNVNPSGPGPRNLGEGGDRGVRYVDPMLSVDSVFLFYGVFDVSIFVLEYFGIVLGIAYICVRPEAHWVYWKATAHGD